jgi:Ser/Thr protein kinase RdoA (MazF antagonist)
MPITASILLAVKKTPALLTISSRMVAMKTLDTQPFSGLNPDSVMNALESLGFSCDGRLLALNSYENRVYQVGIEDGPLVVAKFYRPRRWTDAAILEEHGFLSELAEHELPVVPPLTDLEGRTLYQYESFRFAVFPRQAGRAPELLGRDTYERMGRLIGRIHAVGGLQAYRERPALNIAHFGEEPLAYILTQGFVPPELTDAYGSVALHALERVKSCFDRSGSPRQLRLHGDCYPGNILWTDDGPHFVDFDDSRTGPAIQDLWMLLSGEREEMTGQLSGLLAGYESFYDFDQCELHLIEALRTLRLIHYSAWLARRWDDPAFPAAFPWFNSARYWQDRILELREQIALMDEPPLHLKR